MNCRNQDSQHTAGGDRASKAALNLTSSRQKTATDRVIEAMLAEYRIERTRLYDNYRDKFIMNCY